MRRKSSWQKRSPHRAPKKEARSTSVVAKAALPFVMVTLVLVGLIYNQIRITRRSDVLKQMAQAILDASKRRDYSTPDRISSNSGFWKHLQKARILYGDVENYTIESVNVPTLAFTETVIFRAKRSSNDQTEMFVANGANFIEHQVLQNSPSGIAQPKEKH